MGSSSRSGSSGGKQSSSSGGSGTNSGSTGGYQPRYNEPKPKPPNSEGVKFKDGTKTKDGNAFQWREKVENGVRKSWNSKK